MAPTTRQQSLQQKEKGPQPFPLFKLPPELRLRIYRAILKRPRPLRLQKPLPVLEPAPETETDAYGRQYTIIHDTASYIQQRITLARIKESRAEINNDAIDPTVLRLCKLLYFECRPILYSENTFTLQMDTATTTLTSLHQRNRSLIRHVELFIPTHHDILDQFTDIVRLGLRYCWGLKTFVITLPLLFPEDEPRSRPATRSVYANAFTILRWLPRATEVRLEGVMHEDIGRVVQEQQASREMLDEVSVGFSMLRVG